MTSIVIKIPGKQGATGEANPETLAARDAAIAAQTAAETAETNAETAAATATTQAGIATGAASDALDTLADVNAAGTTQVSAVNSAGATQVTAVETAGTTQTGIVNTAGSTQITAINNANSAYAGTSSTSIAIVSSGQVTFTTQSGKSWTAGMEVIATSGASGANYMRGQVVSYSGTTLVVSVTSKGGSGTLADWLICATIALATPVMNLGKALPWLAVIRADDGSWLFPIAQIDLYNKRCWFNGQIRNISDIIGTQNGDGSYRLTEIPPGLGTNDGSGFTVAVDYNFPARYTTANPPSGTIFSWVNTATNLARMEIAISQAAPSTTVSPGGSHVPTTFLTANGTSNTSGGGSIIAPTTDVVRRTEGVQRYLLTVPASGAVRGQRDCGIQKDFTAVSGTQAAPNRIEIGRLAINGLSPATNVTFRQVIIFNRDLTESEQHRLAEFNEYGFVPRLFIGDSYNNVGQPMAAVRLEAMAAGYGYLPMHFDGVGGRGLHFFCDMADALITENPRYANFGVCVVEGGLDFESLDYPSGPGTTTYTTLSLIQYAKELMDKFSGPRLMLMPVANNASKTQATNTLSITATTTWQALFSNSTGSSRTYTVRNTGVEAARYIVQNGTPSATGTSINPGSSAVVTVPNGQQLYVKTVTTGDTTTVTAIRDTQASLDQYLTAVSNLQATFPDEMVHWLGFMQAQAPDAATYDSQRSLYQVSSYLMVDDIHVAWEGGVGAPGGYGGYKYIGEAFWAKMKRSLDRVRG